jgi:hypothetical protein
MTPIPGDTPALRAFRARNQLIQHIKDALKGRGLDTRERVKDLVISHPGHPERGRVHITLASGEASHARTVWEYLGHVEGHGPGREPDDEPRVDADLITKILTQPEPGNDPP